MKNYMGLIVSYVRLKEETQPFPFLCDFFVLFPFVYNFERESRFLVLIYIYPCRQRDMEICMCVWDGKDRAGRYGYRIDGGNNRRSESEREKLINRNKTNEIILISSINRSVFSTQINTKR